jgi:hypothetical protein
MGKFSTPTSAPSKNFGGLTREHLYDRPRTVCRPDESGRRAWTPTPGQFYVITPGLGSVIFDTLGQI